MKKGTTLIEFIIALVIVGIGLVAITSFLYASWKNWYISKEIKQLQEDLDLAAFTIKAIVEEANYYDIQDIIEGSVPEKGRRIYARYTEDDETIWEKSFYPEGKNLIMEDIKNGGNDTVINTLQYINFSDASEEDTVLTNTVNVEIAVSMSGKTLQNKFSVRARNR